jgi:PIN like domain
LTSESPPEDVIFFLDRNVGRYQVAAALRQHGLRVEAHADHYPQAEAGELSDEYWIREVTLRGWVILTRDGEIRRNPLERAAFVSAGARVFNIRNGQAKAEAVAAAIIKAKSRIDEILASGKRGFIAGISMRGDITFTDEGTAQPE